MTCDPAGMSGITITADTWAGVTFARAIASANAGGGGPAAVFPRLTPSIDTSTSAGVVRMFNTDDTRSRRQRHGGGRARFGREGLLHLAVAGPIGGDRVLADRDRQRAAGRHGDAVDLDLRGRRRRP